MALTTWALLPLTAGCTALSAPRVQALSIAPGANGRQPASKVAQDTPSTPPAAAEDAPAGTAAPGSEEKLSLWERFLDPEDGMLDVVARSEGVGGLLPVPLPISDPAFGIGLLAGAAYFHPRDEAERSEQASGVPPSITFGGAAYTENDSKAAAVGHKGVWDDGRTRYLGLVAAGSINLDFFGVSEEGEDDGGGIPFNIEAVGTTQRIERQLGDTPFFLGARYAFATTKSEFEGAPDLDGDQRNSDIAGAGISLSFDTRDNIFTPNRGTKAQALSSYYAEALGGDFDYEKFDLSWVHYRQFTKSLVVGFRAEGHVTGREAPFYALPFVSLRGVPAFRYLGRYVLVGEFEPRVALSPRWHLVAFGGIGKSAAHAELLDNGPTVYSFGGGFRYLIARKLGLMVGIDVARGPEDTAGYFTIGSAWGGS